MVSIPLPILHFIALYNSLKNFIILYLALYTHDPAAGPSYSISFRVPTP